MWRSGEKEKEALLLPVMSVCESDRARMLQVSGIAAGAPKVTARTLQKRLCAKSQRYFFEIGLVEVKFVYMNVSAREKDSVLPSF